MEHLPEGRICCLPVDSKEDLHMEHPQEGKICSFLVDDVHAADLVHSPEARTGSNQVNAAKGLGKLGGFT